MNKISRLFLVFLLTITTVFAVSACTKKEDNQDNKTTMTEEPGIPLETYLNGNYRNFGDFENRDIYYGKITLKPTKHPTKTHRVDTYGWACFDFFNIPTKKFGNLTMYKFKNFEDIKYDSDKKDKGKILCFFESWNIGFWNGYEIEYSLSYYQNAKNIYTKNYHRKEPTSKGRRKFETDILTSAKNSGTYVFHIRYITHIVGYWDAEKRMTHKDLVFAFQIGDGEVSG